MASASTTASPPPRPQPSPPSTRRILTTEESTQFRRPRPLSSRLASLNEASSNPIATPPRRSSTFSSDSWGEARRSFHESTDDLLLPRATRTRTEDEPSAWQSAPLAFALLPAVAGLMFQNGGAVVSDVLLLGLAAVFLNWSVRLPWDWYRSAQELRKKGEYDDSTVIDDSSGEEHNGDPNPTENTEPPSSPPSARKQRQTQAYETSLRELHQHELLALLCCFLLPALGAYLLHSIRHSLSRPSEGLVSNYNLTIFLLAAELRPLSHLLKLIQARTLHLQRIVAANRPSSIDQRQNLDITDLQRRLALLETSATESNAHPDPVPQTADVRRALQPDLDAIQRALRRCEKRATLQAMRMEARLLEFEAKMAGLAAAAAAAGQGNSNRGVGALLAGWMAVGVAMPVRAMGALGKVPVAAVRAVWEVVRGVGAERGEGEVKPAPRGKGGGLRSGRERQGERLRKVVKR